MSEQRAKKLPIWLWVLIYSSPLLGFFGFLIINQIFPIGTDFKKILIVGLIIELFAYVVLFLALRVARKWGQENQERG